MSALEAHGTARIAAGFGRDPDLLEGLSDATRARLARGDLDEATLHLAWELTRMSAASSDREAFLHLVVLLLEAEGRGSTRLALDDGWIRRAKERLELSDDLAARIGALLAVPHEMIGAPGERTPLIREGGFLYSQRVQATEARVAYAIEARAYRAEAALIAVPDDVVRSPVRLTARQEEAVARALTSRLSVVRGGPGTGKTAIVVAILRAWMRVVDRRLPLSMALAAPTGKAADRMRRSIEAALRALEHPSADDDALLTALPTPRTLHRLLGYSPAQRSLRYNESNRLPARLLVVDEASMIDLALFDRLVRALADDAHLVLLGDPDQLPPVALGAAFRDLAAVRAVSSTELIESHRMRPDRPDGSNILRVAQQVNRGEVPPLEPTDAKRARGPGAIANREETTLLASLDSIRGVHLFEADEPALARFLVRYYHSRIRGDASLRDHAHQTFFRRGARLAPDERIDGIFSFHARSRLLAVTRSAMRATGADAINAFLHRQRLDEAGAPPEEGLLAAGEPVLVTHNDYDRELFNGDQGVILWTAERSASPRLSAVFEKGDGFVAHPLALVRPLLSLGYASTVHKAQGSEHDDVAIVLPALDHPGLLTREILYTAITRARRSVLVIGSETLLRRAIQRRVERSTGLAERIEGLAPKPV